MAPRHILVFIFAAFLQQVQRTFTFPTGFIEIGGACTTLFPEGHAAAAQTSPSPYGISITGGRYTPGLPYEVTLTGSQPFRGVLLQARVVGTDTPIGTWEINNEAIFRLTNCGGQPNSLTHQNSLDKTLPRTVSWKAPLSLRDDVQFIATFVQERRTFWTRIRSASAQYSGTVYMACSSAPCLNGGVCSPGDSSGYGYACQCPSSFSGLNCEQLTLTGSQPFRGVLLQARVVGTDTPIGTWEINNEAIFRLTNCGGQPNSLTHQNSLDKTLPRTVSWKAPLSLRDDVQFIATFVQERRTFWTRIRSASAQYSGTVYMACSSAPCLNGGVCSPGDSSGYGYACQCPSSFSGLNCEQLVTDDPCVSNPCQNNGLCLTAVSGGSYVCRCVEGFTGTNCESVTTESPCLSQPCLNGATCIPDAGQQSYICRCAMGFQGQRCQDVIPDPSCSPDPCNNGGTCIETEGALPYFCQCTPGFAGINCDELERCIDDVTCLNGGICFAAYESNAVFCVCQAGFRGLQCEEEIPQPCREGLCENGGVCFNNANNTNYQCVCPPSFTGRHCETYIGSTDGCLSGPCLNGGTCFPHPTQVGAFLCQCPTGYAGTSCEIDINFCFTNPCLNGGTCTDIGTGYMCACPIQFKGTNCEIGNFCEPNPCLNGGTCNSGQSGFTCECLQGYSGTRCEMETGCNSSPCQNGGTCFTLNGGNGYFCTCPEGYMGTSCEIASPCASDPCLNGGTCHGRRN
ncbi:uncharacterized protein [Amphiura filiformis]|uniref:uncharacterized protein n=1 Tax=Amphiura filiformis TaxID=82378 RepID=UPI003B21DEF3